MLSASSLSCSTVTVLLTKREPSVALRKPSAGRAVPGHKFILFEEEF